MEDVYLITATHADGSRRQWVGKPEIAEVKNRSLWNFPQEKPTRKVDLADPFLARDISYQFTEIASLPDCALKDKAITQ